MKAKALANWAVDKKRFLTVWDYVGFARAVLEFRANGGFQAELVARNRNEYRFFQYKTDVDFRLTRPINTSLFVEIDQFDDEASAFHIALNSVATKEPVSRFERNSISRVIYTCQQAIGIALDALPAARQNTARKVNGDLFERLIGLAIECCGIDCESGTLTIPVTDDSGAELLGMKYQHDLIIEVEGDLKAIGSVKTTSKDRVDKIFIDKFLCNRLTGVDTPHFAIFLHDVQRAGKEPDYRVSNTFLPGHFKGYTIKLNPLDGVYYCDLLPIMRSDPLLHKEIHAIDRFFLEDLPRFAVAATPPSVKIDAAEIVKATS